MEEQRKIEEIIEKYVVLLWLTEGEVYCIFSGSKEEAIAERRRICSYVNKHKLIDFSNIGEAIPDWRIKSVKSMPELEFLERQQQWQEHLKQKAEEQKAAQEELNDFLENQQALKDVPFDSGGSAVDLLKKKTER